MFQPIIKNVIKDTDDQPETHGVRSRRVRSAGASAPWGRGTPPSWPVDVFASLEALSKPRGWRILTEASSRGRDQLH